MASYVSCRFGGKVCPLQLEPDPRFEGHARLAAQTGGRIELTYTGCGTTPGPPSMPGLPDLGPWAPGQSESAGHAGDQGPGPL